MVTKTEAEQKEKQVALGIAELIESYHLSNRAEGKSEKTTTWYKEMLSAFIRYLREEHEMSDLSAFTVSRVRQYVLYLRNKPRFKGHPSTPQKEGILSPHTVQCHVRALKAFSTWVYTEGYTEANRLKNLKLPKAPTLLIEPLTPEEIDKILSCIQRKSYVGIRDRAILVTFLDTGLRASELAGIKLADLNLRDGFVKVMGKGAKERTVPIGQYVRTVLLNYLENVRPQRKANHLFLSRAGKPVTANAIKLIFSRIARKSGVKRLHDHL